MEGTKLTKELMELYSQFQREHSLLFSDRVVRRFFENSRHIAMLCIFLQNNEPSSRIELEDAFRHFFFTIRFTKYIYSTIKFNAIVQDRKRHLYEQRNVLILDKPVGKDEESSMGDLFMREKPTGSDWTSNPEEFRASIQDEHLYEALNGLTQKQILVATLAFSQLYLDTEIAEKLNVSQQAVCKTRKKALKKLQNALACLTRGNQAKEAN